MIDKKTKMAIQNSSIFLVIGTNNYFEDYTNGGRMRHMVEFAKSLGKPFRIILDDGVVIPKDFEEGVKDYKVSPHVLKKYNKLCKDEMMKFFSPD